MILNKYAWPVVFFYPTPLAPPLSGQLVYQAPSWNKIMVGEFLRALDDFLIRLEKYHGTSSDWVGVCVAGELSKATRLHHHYFLLFILLCQVP